MSQVQDATVLSTRPVVVDGTQSGTGAVAGGVIGAISGGSVGGRREGQVAGVLGAVAGAVIGNAIERNGTREQPSRSCCRCATANAVPSSRRRAPSNLHRAKP